MFARICQIASLLSLLLSVSMLGGGYYAFRFVTSEQFKNKLLNEVMGNVSKPMQKMIEGTLPDMTSPHVPLPYKLK